MWDTLVCIYAAPHVNPTSLQLPDSDSEMCALAFDFKHHRSGSRGSTTHRIAVLNIYRNHSITTEQHKQEVTRALNYIRNQHNIRKHLVVGDFNATSVRLPDLFELTHDDLFHKQNSNTAKRKIDKAFTNDKSTKIDCVLPTCENRTDKEFGHKVAVLRLGSTAPGTQPKARFATSPKKFILQLEQNKTLFPNNLKELMNHKLDNNEKALFLINRLEQAAKLSEIKIKNDINHVAIDKIEETAEYLNKCPKKLKTLSKFVSNFKEGIQSDQSHDTPTLEALAKKGSDKLAALKPVNHEIATKIIEERYKNDSPKIQLSPPSKRLFKSLCLESSSSGALDHFGLPLKLTKIAIKTSASFLDAYYELCMNILEKGEIPEAFKIDSVNFLYKRKGLRSDASNYRPITIAPSLGKHLDKVLSYYLNRMLDDNTENHAYTAQKSCQSAIMDLQKTLSQYRKIAKRDKKFQYIPLICAEDMGPLTYIIITKTPKI